MFSTIFQLTLMLLFRILYHIQFRVIPFISIAEHMNSFNVKRSCVISLYINSFLSALEFNGIREAGLDGNYANKLTQIRLCRVKPTNSFNQSCNSVYLNIFTVVQTDISQVLLFKCYRRPCRQLSPRSKNPCDYLFA